MITSLHAGVCCFPYTPDARHRCCAFRHWRAAVVYRTVRACWKGTPAVPRLPFGPAAPRPSRLSSWVTRSDLACKCATLVVKGELFIKPAPAASREMLGGRTAALAPLPYGADVTRQSAHLVDFLLVLGTSAGTSPHRGRADQPSFRRTHGLAGARTRCRSTSSAWIPIAGASLRAPLWAPFGVAPTGDTAVPQRQQHNPGCVQVKTG